MIVLWTDEDEGEVADRRSTAGRALASLAGTAGVVGDVSPALLSKDGQALEGVVQLRPDLGERLPETLDRIRAAAERVPGSTVRLAGPPPPRPTCPTPSPVSTDCSSPWHWSPSW